MTKDFPRNATFWEQLAAIYFTMRYSYRKIDNIQATVEAVRNEFSIREKLVADYPSNAAYRSNLNKAYTDGQEFAVEWSPQFASRPGDFLKVFDLYAETRDRQLANLPAAALRPPPWSGTAAIPHERRFSHGESAFRGDRDGGLERPLRGDAGRQTGRVIENGCPAGREQDRPRKRNLSLGGNCAAPGGPENATTPSSCSKRTFAKSRTTPSGDSPCFAPEQPWGKRVPPKSKTPSCWTRSSKLWRNRRLTARALDGPSHRSGGWIPAAPYRPAGGNA